MGEFLITFREALEASLILGIIFTAIRQSGQMQLHRLAWYGVGAAILASLLLAVGLNALTEAGGEGYDALFEGLMMFVAAGFLLWMIAWMARRKNIASELKSQTHQAIQTSGWAIFLLAFTAVVREGVETVLFLGALSNQTGGLSLAGAFGGIGVAAAAGLVIFVGGKRLPIKQFFNISSVALIIVAAGMVAYGTHELEEFAEGEEEHTEHAEASGKHHDSEGSDSSQSAGVNFPEGKAFRIFQPLSEEPSSSQAGWYTKQEDGRYVHVLHDKGSVGVYLKHLVGYNSEPSFLELGLWAITLIGGFGLWRWASRG